MQIPQSALTRIPKPAERTLSPGPPIWKLALRTLLSRVGRVTPCAPSLVCGRRRAEDCHAHFFPVPAARHLCRTPTHKEITSSVGATSANMPFVTELLEKPIARATKIPHVRR